MSPNENKSKKRNQLVIKGNVKRNSMNNNSIKIPSLNQNFNFNYLNIKDH